jgi:hypothetical protein
VNRRAFITGLGAVLAAPLAADAQQAGKVYRIGYLANRPSASANRYHDALRQGLRDFGYVEGQNLVIEYRWAEGRDERYPGMAADLVGRKVDVIVRRYRRGRPGSARSHSGDHDGSNCYRRRWQSRRGGTRRRPGPALG